MKCRDGARASRITTATFEHARAAVLRYGYNPNAYLILTPPPFEFFTAPGIDGVVAFQQHSGVWLCGGEPICAANDLVPLAAAMRRAAHAAGCTLAFLPTTPRATALLAERLNFDHVKVGEDLFYDVATWSPRGQRMKHIRANLNRAQREGVIVQRCASHEITPAIRARVQEIVSAWYRTREMSALSFLLGVHPLALLEDRRLFIAWWQERIVGFLSCSPIPARNAWYLEDSIRGDDAPIGTGELLFAETLAALHAEGAAYATGGMAALANCGPAFQPPEHQPAGWLFVQMRAHLNRFYHFQSLQFYKEKFGPTLTEDASFCWYPRGLWRPRLVTAVLNALDPEGVPAAVLSPLTQAHRRCRLANAGHPVGPPDLAPGERPS